MNAIRTRLLLATSVVLAAFLAATAVAVQRAHRASALEALQARLQSVVYTLLAAAEEREGGRMALPQQLPVPRLVRPDSGLQAWVLDGEGRLFWRSGSLLGQTVPPVSLLAAGQRVFRVESRRILLAHGIEWEDDQGHAWPYTFVVSEARAPFDQEQRRFRATLWSGLGIMALGLLAVQLLVLRWGLAPLGQARRQLEEIRAGQRRHLDTRQPQELQPLARAIDRLLDESRASRERYRHALDDLAHALKTPLAYLRTLLDDPSVSCKRLRRAATEPLSQMERTMRQQLARAAASGRSALQAPVPVAALARRLVRALGKVHGPTAPQTELALDETLAFCGDEADLMELLGNLLDNAFKYGARHVRLSGTCREGQLQLVLDDDGPGIPPGRRRAVLERGVRLDEQRPGQGLGLASAAEIARIYDGRITLDQAPLGGLRVQVVLRGC